LGLRALYWRSQGIPRLINVIADRALMAGFAREQAALGESLVERAADEAMPGNPRYWMRRYGRWAAAALLLIAIVAAAQVWLRRPSPSPVVTDANASIAPAPVHEDALAQIREKIAHSPDADLDAWTQLLSRWQVNSSQISVRDAAKCQNVLVAGLDCLHGFGTIEQLARFDRPLILVLHQGESHAAAVLLDVDANFVRLDVGGLVKNVAKDAMRELWSGEFMAVWRLPDNVPAALHTGDAGAGVAWVKQQLAHMDKGKAADAGPAYFDASLEERVRKLQVAYGIKPDGIVGPETLFALSSLDDGGPHLFRNIE
jgi:general secretion pathway protein A